MNKIKALITALVVASSSTAMASPTTFSAHVRGSFTVGSGWSSAPRSERAVIVRDHRSERARPRPAKWRYHGERFYPNRYEPVTSEQPGLDEGSFDWYALGVRSAIAPDHVDVPRSIQAKALHVEARDGMPRLSTISVRYYGGLVHEIDASRMSFNRGGVVIPLDTSGTAVHQIVFYPAAGSTGALGASVGY